MNIGCGISALSPLSRSASDRIKGLAPIAYWPLSDTTGGQATDLSGNSQRADYASSGITYSANGIGDGRTAITLNGTDTHVNIRTTVNTVDTLWNGNAFSMIGWGMVDSASRWTDVTAFRYLVHMRATDATYYAVLGGRNQTNNQIEWRRRAGGAIVSQTYTFASPPTGWFCMGMTCNQSLPELRFYLWEQSLGWLKVGTSVSAQTSWTGNVPVEGTSVLGAGSLTLQEWVGSLAHCALWDRTLSNDEMRVAMSK